VLPVVEIRTASEWYDFEAKYVTGDTQYTVPAELSDETTEQLQAIALKTFECLDAEGFGRIDFRLSPDGKPYVLELNSIPGFTATSLLPKAAEAAGVGFSELCCRIMEQAHL
jgi:D-alanine-D-alanine ligase